MVNTPTPTGNSGLGSTGSTEKRGVAVKAINKDKHADPVLAGVLPNLNIRTSGQGALDVLYDQKQV